MMITHSFTVKNYETLKILLLAMIITLQTFFDTSSTNPITRPRMKKEKKAICEKEQSHLLESNTPF